MFEFNGQILVSQMITFLIALFIVWKAAWKPLIKFIRERQEKIRGTLDEAERTRKAIAVMEQEYKERLGQIEQKSGELIAIARLEAQKVRDQILAKAQEEASEARRKGQEQLQFERDQIIREIRSQVVDLSMAVARKVVAEQAAASLQQAKFEKILTELESTKGPYRAQ